MGRKSNRAKEKKARRQEERAAMDAVCAKVDAANKLDDPLATFPAFKNYDRNGLNLQIECKRVTTLNPLSVEWAFELTRANMQTLYEQSEWGWKEREKREEMNDERAWYLLARDSDSAPVAFSHFRFDVECGEEVLYCYEVQLESRVRRKGLGKFLIQILQLIANSTQMKKVMLTVFKHNHGAYQFFREALQFEIDETSPSMSGCCGDDCSYEILSRRTKHGEASAGHTHGGGHCGGCCHWLALATVVVSKKEKEKKEKKPATPKAVCESLSHSLLWAFRAAAVGEAVESMATEQGGIMD